MAEKSAKRGRQGEGGGRPSSYRPEYAQQLIEFFNVEAFRDVVTNAGLSSEKTHQVANKFPTMGRFAAQIGVCRDTLYAWAEERTEDGVALRNPEWVAAMTRAKDLQEAILVEGGMAGTFAPAFAIFTAKNICGWRDKVEQEVTGKDGAPLLPQIDDTELARRIAFALTQATIKKAKEPSHA